MWEFPGGKIEPGESEYEAIAREIEEEFGWNVSPKRLVSSVYHEYSEFAINLKIIEVSMDFSKICRQILGGHHTMKLAGSTILTGLISLKQIMKLRPKF